LTLETPEFPQEIGLLRQRMCAVSVRGKTVFTMTARRTGRTRRHEQLP
jgi:hypothetical protein